MTANRIQQVALAHFAEHGYDGASLAKIADDVGIKKPSIYAHYKSKEDLFLHVVQYVYNREQQWIEAYFTEQNETRPSLEYQLKQLLYLYRQRYAQQLELKFLLRVSFFPPAVVQSEVMHRLYVYLDDLEQKLMLRLQQAMETGEVPPNAGVAASEAATAFMCILDALFVEMLYGEPERVSKKLEAAWPLYWRGLTN
ncbi:TetR/AcrR family transcriptional regulator [Paenibacillus sp. 481]|uniref:TetR/AcrR family transcriptional regulator n=1 Tax=Paenibacillus sp. 481 TaxID=2835869 RepID=UPI001E33F276|nr:TetR/AcrR family transcriptional regulator [Paenibacillus sp. 481]UHA75619.1 TetR/AcrR family transcriptional regulator [Paenibacillus sp. 481]